SPATLPPKPVPRPSSTSIPAQRPNKAGPRPTPWSGPPPRAFSKSRSVRVPGPPRGGPAAIAAPARGAASRYSHPMSIYSVWGALEIGLIFGLVALGVLISFRVLNFPDLTVDGSFPLGGATAAILIHPGTDPFLATG